MNATDRPVEPELYYYKDGFPWCYYIRNKRGNFIGITEKRIRIVLKRLGFSDEKQRKS